MTTTTTQNTTTKKSEIADSIYWVIRAIRDTAEKSRHDDADGDFYQISELASIAMSKLAPLMDPED